MNILSIGLLHFSLLHITLVNKLHFDTISKILKLKDMKSLNDLLSIDGVNGHCDYIEPLSIKDVHTKMSDLSILQLNVRGLLNKHPQIKHLLSNDNVSLPLDVLLLCETWLKPSTTDLVNISNYKSFHRTRKDHIGGYQHLG